ncbi:hypothetical protein DFH07DRAFT_765803 [Mycena maculata]|uniref:Uncharacterized protein n=1 Tax=Mycena maculata TaxID=230809 RepID=A0AAD7K7T4_9AGAR|nr:hypothetical protein DFH07DRAFT_765803 [Mycena maculata]
MAFSTNSFIRRAQAEIEVWHETAGTGGRRRVMAITWMGGDNDAMVALRKPSQQGSKERCGNTHHQECARNAKAIPEAMVIVCSREGQALIKRQRREQELGGKSGHGQLSRSTYNEQKRPQRGPWERGWVKVSKKTRQEEERSDGIKGKVVRP